MVLESGRTIMTFNVRAKNGPTLMDIVECKYPIDLTCEKCSLHKKI